jgi:hypothetical protein
MAIKFKKKAMSEVVSSILMVVLVLVLVGVVWGVINNVVNQQIRTTEKCSGNFGKITIDEKYTCYNLTSKSFDFSIVVGDIAFDKLLVSIASQGSTKVLVLNSTSTILTDVINYPNKTGGGITAPTPNSGKTYIYNGTTFRPDSIQVAAVIGGEQCQTSDSLTIIEDCSAY